MKWVFGVKTHLGPLRFPVTKGLVEGTFKLDELYAHVRLEQ